MSDINLTGAAVWSTCNGGTTPASGDTVYLGTTGATGYALTLDGANSSTYTCVAIKALSGPAGTPNGGTVVLGNATSTITADLQAGTATLLTCGTGKTLTINGTATGGTAGSIYCILVNSTGVLAGLTKAKGGSSTTTYGVYWGPTSGSGASSVTAAEGGSAVNAAGVGVYGTSSGVTLTIGTVKGGSHANAPGLLPPTTGVGMITINAIDLSGTGLPVGLNVLKFAAGCVLQYQTSGGSALKFYAADTMPADSKVWSGSGTYGAGDFTPSKVASSIPTSGGSGTLAAADIKSGVTVDPGTNQIAGSASGGGLIIVD